MGSLGAFAHAEAQSVAERRVMLIGPNVLVSAEPALGHLETTLAADLKEETKLIGGAFVVASDGGPSRTYASSDGGFTWETTTPREVLRHGGGDPVVSLGSALQGTAYFATLMSKNYDVGVGRDVSGEVFFFRSSDFGQTWDAPTNLRVHDHPQLAVDQTYGPYAGFVYLNTADGFFRSHDEGRTFIGPTHPFSRAHMSAFNIANSIVLRDGTLMLSYEAWSGKEAPAGYVYVTTSSDGGVSFTPAAEVGVQHYPDSNTLHALERRAAPVDYTYPTFAADPTSGRLYVAWADAQSDRGRIVLSSSSDRGRHWTAARVVDVAAPTATQQFQPMLAVNRQGVVGLGWFDTRLAPAVDGYDCYFTVSTDSGRSFLPPKRVSSATSFPLRGNQFRPQLNAQWHGSGPDDYGADSTLQLFFLSAQVSRPGGGDYMGMAASADGVFHPFWIDSRTGTGQVWTARIEVVSASQWDSLTSRVPSQTTNGEHHPAGSQTDYASSQVVAIVDPVAYDPNSNETIVPIRLRNVSSDTIVGPLVARVVRLTASVAPGPDSGAVTILNATNARTGVGATFDYTKALGDYSFLPPGGVTEAIPWRVRRAANETSNFFLSVAIAHVRR